MWLPDFRAEYLPMYLSSLEDRISENLHLYLQAKAKTNDLLFHFNEKKGVDFLIYIEPRAMFAKPIFVIEAKRLPSSDNGKQYVVGRTSGADGIERFKCEQEGFVINRNRCAMIAYVQEHTFEYWFERINRWFSELIVANENYDDFDWEESDKLLKLSFKTEHMATFTSNHSRKTLPRLMIHHFWLDMQNNSPTE